MNLRAELAAALGSAYTIESELGGGGMSNLFLALDNGLNRRVVVKVVGAESTQLRSVERFRREVALAASLQHPHIVSVLAAGDVAGLPYFIMPYVEGRSLRQRLDDGPCGVRETVAILRDVARACAYAHERGVVHRDIKPDNVLLAGGSAMITDFGVAKALSSLARESGDANLTHEGISLGTPGYMAPEQVAGDPRVDFRADLYALGIMAYEMLTGATPFGGRTPHAILAAQISETPQPIAVRRGDLPAGLAALVMQCLEKNPGDRPESAQAIVERLDDPSILSGPFARTVPLASQRRRRTFGWAGAALGIALAAGALWVVTRADADAADRSIAVLPLENVGGDSATAYFSEGLTDEITLALTKLPGVQVASRGAAAEWRGRVRSPREIRRALHVATYLDGSVQVSGGRLRLIAQLTDARRGVTLWSDRFEGDLDDVFAVQDSIAAAIAEALRQHVGGTAAAAGSPRGSAGTNDVQAYDLFLRGRFNFQRRSPEALRAAIADFEAAIGRDPGFARAFAGLADVYAVLPLYSPVNPDSVRTIALGYVERALAIDSTLADARASRGMLHMAAWRWAEADSDFTAALALDSAAANAWQWYGEWQLYNGRADDAVRALARAAALEPSSAPVVALHALALGAARQTADALTTAQRAVALDPGSAIARLMNGTVLLYAGRAAEAVRELETARRLGADVPHTRGVLGYALARSGQRPRAEALRDSLLQQATLPGTTSALARVELGLGDTAQALTWFEWSAGAHDPIFASEPLGSPLYDAIRRSSRFAAVLRRVGLDAARLTR